MISNEYKLTRYDADEGKVFDWADLTAHTSTDEEGNEVVEHLYAKTLFISITDDINNYVEIDAPQE